MAMQQPIETGHPSARRRAVVERVLAAADALAPARAEPGRCPRLWAEGPGGCIEMGQRPCLVLGRGERCDLRLRGGGVSRFHAAVVRRGGEYWLEDLGSHNGTWHAGERVERRRIADGDEIRLCDAAVRFHVW